jgi:hypothetical protein
MKVVFLKTTFPQVKSELDTIIEEN